MSSYENYSVSAGTYDHTRGPVGVEIIIGCLANSPVQLGQQYLLDAGCGTGNYSRVMIDHVHRISAVDMNTAMLSQARSKFSASQRQRIKFHQSGIEQIPFEAGGFDGVMINQVLHHLHDDPSSDYSNTRGVLREFARVLKPGGVLVINICSHEQLAKGFWYSELIPEQVGHMQQRHVPLFTLQRLLEECGYDYGGRIVPMDALIQGEDYFNPRGPIDAVWRSGDSVWSTVPTDEMQNIRTRLEGLERDGALEDFVARCDGTRREVGQVTFLHARRR